MKIEMGCWMDITKVIKPMLSVEVLLIVLAMPLPVLGQPEQDATTPDVGNVPPPVDFADGEGIIGNDVPTRDDFLSGEEEKLPSYGLFNIFVSLVLVLVIFWVIFKFVVRPLMRGAMMGRGVDDFRIIASLPITPTKSVQVIKLVDRLLVVGIGEGGVRLVAEITDAEEVSEILKALDDKNPARHHPYKKAFDTMLKRKDEDGFEEKQKTFNTSLGRLKEKIDSLRDGKGEVEEG